MLTPHKVIYYLSVTNVDYNHNFVYNYINTEKSDRKVVIQMKKIISAIFLLLSLTFIFSSCASETVSIEDYEWQMRTVMGGNIETVQIEDDLIVAVGEHDELYPEAKIVDLTLIAKDGKITITDKTNGKSYTGTYKVQQKTPKGTAYEITINGQDGYATVAPTEYYDGSEVPTLPINLGEYSLYFIPKK